MHFATKVIHAGQQPDPATGAVATPIYQTSTFAQTEPGQHQGYTYARGHNPTRTALQQNIAALENGQHGLCFASGMAATDAVLRLLQPGDEVVVSQDLYGGTHRIMSQIYTPAGLTFRFVNARDLPALEAALTPATRLVWLETPTNPLLRLVDIRAVAGLTQSRGIWLAVDNTFASPYLQNPLDLGADIVMHSVTKYLAGHSDLIMGALVVNDADLARQLAFVQNATGAVPGPQDCFLALRGIKTLHLRMERHCQNALAVAQLLASHPAAGPVHYPGLPTHPDYDLARRQMRQFGGVVSFELRAGGVADAVGFMRRLRLFVLAESLAGVESMVAHPATMSHTGMPPAERARIGVQDTLIRLSVGIEDIHDLLADLEQALG